MCDWLPSLVEIVSCDGLWERYLDVVYTCFKDDFVFSKPSLRGQSVVPNYDIIMGKEETFWHIISNGPVEDERNVDFERCKRIKWPRGIIDYFPKDGVLAWRNHNRGGRWRTYLSPRDFSYLVVLFERKGYYLLGTAFPVQQTSQRRKYEKEYKASQALQRP